MSHEPVKTYSIVDVLTVLGQEKKLFLSVLVLGMIGTLAYAFLMPKKYAAVSVILPPQQAQATPNAALMQLGAALTGLGGGAVRSPDEMFAALLKTRRIREPVIRKFDLQIYYHKKNLESALKALDQRVTVTTDKKSGLITLSTVDVDPDLAAKLTNEQVAQLRLLLTQLAVTDAQQRRVFFQDQIAKATGDLANAELRFRAEQANSGMVISQALVEANVKASVSLRTEIANRQVRLQALSRFATQKSEEYQRLVAELDGLQKQLQLVEKGNQSAAGSSASGSNAVAAYRDVKVLEATLEALLKQFEIAKLDEAREGPLLQTVDAARPPDNPSSPGKIQICAVGGLISLFAAAFTALFFHRAKHPAEGRSGQMTRLKSAWFGG